MGHDDQFDNWSINWSISDPFIGELIKVTHFSFLRKMPSHVALKPNFFFFQKNTFFLFFFFFFFYFFFRTSNSNQFVEPQKVMVTTEEQQVETRSLQDLWEEHANDWDLETRALLAHALRPSTLQNDSVLKRFHTFCGLHDYDFFPYNNCSRGSFFQGDRQPVDSTRTVSHYCFRGHCSHVQRISAQRPHQEPAPHLTEASDRQHRHQAAKEQHPGVPPSSSSLIT